MPSKEDLRYYQALPLKLKIKMTESRIHEWIYRQGSTYISFSGGKDSTVLLDIVRKLYPSTEAVFVNTGLEYPEIQSFVKSFDNVTILRPEMRFDEVIRKYGYPFIKKEVANCIHQAKRARSMGKSTQRLRQLEGTHTDKNGNKSIFNHEKYYSLLDVDFEISDKCCDVMKKKPTHDYSKITGKVQMTGQMAEESRLREQQWLKNGCNAYDTKLPTSNPISFWTEQDVLQYIKEKNLPIASVYGEVVYKDTNGKMYDNLLCDCNAKLCTTGCDRTGCIYCAFGAQHDCECGGESRFVMLKRTHPRQYDYCLGGGGYDSDGLWKPTKEGLGMAHCIDEINKIYGKDFIKY